MAVNLSLLQYSRPLGQLEGSPKMPVSRVAPASTLPHQRGTTIRYAIRASRADHGAPSRAAWQSKRGGFVIERHRELQYASPRSWEDANPRQCAELACQFAILGAGATQRRRVSIRHAKPLTRPRSGTRSSARHARPPPPIAMPVASKDLMPTFLAGLIAEPESDGGA
jgi:hypothetical protein